MSTLTLRTGTTLLAACLGLTACGDDTPGAGTTSGLTGLLPASTGSTPATTSSVGTGDGGLEAGATTAGDAGFDLGSLLGDGGLSGFLDAGATGDAGTPDDASVDTDAGTDADAGDDGDADAGAGPAAWPPVDDLGATGPFETNNPLGEAEGPNCSIHRPATLGEGGRKHPVILWGMGTGGFNTYQAAFDLWASHGFIVAAGLSGQGQGSGEEMLGCLDYVCDQYAPHVDCQAAGASGHSQGGAGAVMAGVDPRVITTAPVEPYIEMGFGGFDDTSIGQQTGPMLLQSGTLDWVAAPVNNQQPIFDGVHVPVFWASAVGVGHVSPGVDGLVTFRENMLAWFRLHLMGDESFRDMFYGDVCTECDDSAFEVLRKGMN